MRVYGYFLELHSSSRKNRYIAAFTEQDSSQNYKIRTHRRTVVLPGSIRIYFAAICSAKRIWINGFVLHIVVNRSECVVRSCQFIEVHVKGPLKLAKADSKLLSERIYEFQLL